MVLMASEEMMVVMFMNSEIISTQDGLGLYQASSAFPTWIRGESTCEWYVMMEKSDVGGLDHGPIIAQLENLLAHSPTFPLRTRPSYKHQEIVTPTRY